jgi:hypothetical protein
MQVLRLAAPAQNDSFFLNQLLARFTKEPLIKCAFYDPTFPQGLKPIDSLSFMYGLKPVPFKSPT